MASKAQYGGHDYEFVGKVSNRFICQICTKVLHDPHLAVCCGQHFCESCLNKWFIRQAKESCPHCRAEGEGFNHVIHKGLRSEVNQLKIRCSNRGEGYQWTGELGTLKQHLESDSGCGYVTVYCSNQCIMAFEQKLVSIKRKDLGKHLASDCILRPYQCEYCGLKDTYMMITGDCGPNVELEDCHQAECPEAPLISPIGADLIRSNERTWRNIAVSVPRSQ